MLDGWCEGIIVELFFAKRLTFYLFAVGQRQVLLIPMLSPLASAGHTLVALVKHDNVARWQFSPPDLDKSGGFESCLAGKNYFWLILNFWQN
jgi:hypothetical protein